MTKACLRRDFEVFRRDIRRDTKRDSKRDTRLFIRWCLGNVAASQVAAKIKMFVREGVAFTSVTRDKGLFTEGF